MIFCFGGSLKTYTKCVRLESVCVGQIDTLDTHDPVGAAPYIQCTGHNMSYLQSQFSQLHYAPLQWYMGALCTIRPQYAPPSRNVHHGAQGRLYFLKNSGFPVDRCAVTIKNKILFQKICQFTPLPPPIFNGLKIGDFPGLCVASLTLTPISTTCWNIQVHKVDLPHKLALVGSTSPKFHNAQIFARRQHISEEQFQRNCWVHMYLNGSHG